jgi:aminopeptidase-like protein
LKLNTLYNFFKTKIFPINRSITGKGTLRTLKFINQKIPNIKIKNIKSGTKVYNWRVPQEWNISSAYILDKYKKKIIDFDLNNLHIVGYSQPVKKYITLKKLLPRIHVHRISGAIPYVTSYYKKYWGFCCTNKLKKKMSMAYNPEDKFKVFISSSFKKNGKMHYGECYLPGKSKKEIIISTYICHPSMANNELSGPIVSCALINFFKKKKFEYSLRFLFLPETIGSISYISKNLNNLKKNNILGGFNLSCIGDDRNHSCILSKYSNAITDKSLLEAYKKNKIKYKRYSFLKRGSDERQFNSPGVDIPFTSIFRSKYGTYKEYHTSLDNFELVTLSGITGGFKIVKSAIENMQNKIIPISKYNCEPMLSKKNLYTTANNKTKKKTSRRILDFLQYSDGKNDLHQISKYIKINYHQTKKVYDLLKKESLIF